MNHRTQNDLIIMKDDIFITENYHYKTTKQITLSLNIYIPMNKWFEASYEI